MVDRRRRVLVGQLALAGLGVVSLVGIFHAVGLVDLGDVLRPDDGVGADPDDDGPPGPPVLERHPDPPVLLSEIATAAGAGVLDDDGDAADWIELFNPGDEAITVSGLHLSDDPDDPTKWRLPEVTLESRGNVVIWATGKDRADPAADLHANFALDRQGEEVLLVDADGRTLLDRFDAVDMPSLASYGRDPDDLERTCFFAIPEPGAPNDARCFEDATLGAPTFSVPAGFHDQPVPLEIRAGEPDDTIIYTLDGSYPDLDDNADRTLVYEGPLLIEDRSGEPNRLSLIDAALPPGAVAGPPPSPRPDLDGPVQKATVVRARVPDGAETVATYFVGDQLVRPQLPVLSLVLDEEYLFDHDIGIYVAGRTYEEHAASGDEGDGWNAPANYNQRGREWERPPRGQERRAAVLEHCPAGGGSCDYRTALGVRIHGGASRTLQQKSLRLYARGVYGADAFEYPFFGDDAPADHRRLILRNAGQDQANLMYLDGYLQDLMSGFEADTQTSQPAVLFINGEYWGLYNIRERYDDDYLEVVHGVDRDLVEVIDGGPSFIDDGAFVAWLADADPASAATVDRIEQTIDVESFFDFMIANIYAGNTDWPGNNVRLWRDPNPVDEPGPGAARDGRWQWLVNDLDGAGDWEASDPTHDVLADPRMQVTDDPTFQWGLPLLFDRVMGNPALRERFLVRFADHLNTALAPTRALEVLAEHRGRVESEIGRHLERWQATTLEAWLRSNDDLEAFVRERPAVQRQQLVDRYDLAGTSSVAIAADPTAGRVNVNGITIDATAPGVVDPGDWTGVYFRGLPLRLEAVPYDGYRFVRWEGLPANLASDAVVEIPLEGDVAVTAVFERG